MAHEFTAAQSRTAAPRGGSPGRRPASIWVERGHDRLILPAIEHPPVETLG